MKIIAITGGIGSGKSYVANIMSLYFNVLHINTDEMARRQMMKGGESYNRVVEEFRDKIPGLLDENEEINRPLLSKYVFSYPEELKKLDDLTHPIVIEKIREIIQEEKQRDFYEAVLIESALVFESGIDGICDEVWYVYAPVETRIKRLTESRGYSREKIDSVLSGQLDEQEFLNRCDKVIKNDYDTAAADLIRQISQLLEEPGKEE